MISLLSIRFVTVIGAENKFNKQSLNQGSTAFHTANFISAISSAFSSFSRDSLESAMAKGYIKTSQMLNNSIKRLMCNERIENECICSLGLSPEISGSAYRNFSARRGRS